MKNSTSDLIDAFVSAYEREYDFYREASRLCHALCETMLGGRGIRAIVTHRAKNPAKLRMKLQQRLPKKSYASLDDMRADIADLAGVRIALYFPGDRILVKKLVEENFTIGITKAFPQPPRPHGKKFDGYHADHFRLRMPVSSLAQDQKRFSDALVEVQLGSVLMHAWAEVEHDLIYKPDNGDPSEDEVAILDELNGMVLAGEIALERLQRALERRLRSSTSSFNNHYEFAAFLHDYIRDKADSRMPPMGRVDALWEILRESGKDTATTLSGVLEKISKYSPDETIADQVADEVLKDDPKLIDRYISVQSQYTHSEDIRMRLGEFLSNWIIVERTFALIAQSRVKEPANVMIGVAGMDAMVTALSMPNPLRAALRRLRELRNRWVHGIAAPSKILLEQSTAEFDELFQFFKRYPEPDVVQAFEIAHRHMAGEPDTQKS